MGTTSLILTAIIIVIVLLIIYFRPEYTVQAIVGGGLVAAGVQFINGDNGEAIITSFVDDILLAPIVLAAGGASAIVAVPAGIFRSLALPAKMSPKAVFAPVIRTLKMVFSVLRGTALGAVGTTLEVVGHGLPLDTIADIAGVCIEAFITLASIAQQMVSILKSATRMDPLVDIMQMVDFTGGPAGVYARVTPLIEKNRADENMRNFMSSVCTGVPGILFDAGNFLIQMISAFIPDDGGWIGVLLRGIYAVGFEAGRIIAQHPYELLYSIYQLMVNMPFPYQLNKQLQQFVEDRVFRIKYITQIFTIIYDLLKKAKEKMNTFGVIAQWRLSKPVDDAIAMMDQYILPPEKIEKMSEAIEYLNTQAFALAIVMSACKNIDEPPAEPATIKPEEVTPQLAEKLKKYIPPE